MNQMHVINHALQQWATWDALGFAERDAIVARWAQNLNDQAAQQMIAFQRLCAAEHMAQTQVMPGPTGELNELYCCGRGVFIIHAEADAPLSATVAALSAALLAGNTVVLALPEGQVPGANALAQALVQAGCGRDVVQVAPVADLHQLITHPLLAGFAYAGTAATAHDWLNRLAQQEGALTQLVAETDPTTLSTVGESTYCLRFVTERTRSINLTAIGGNASLMESSHA
ncbi:MAG: aldehyde dehydrogenase family protein [Neisseriaceae bacterium]|nr:aldehyde dehydrogenase family protein [Neisseriaceae bacterium]